jgi:hypothetical protein
MGSTKEVVGLLPNLFFNNQIFFNNSKRLIYQGLFITFAEKCGRMRVFPQT